MTVVASFPELQGLEQEVTRLRVCYGEEGWDWAAVVQGGQRGRGSSSDALSKPQQRQGLDSEPGLQSQHHCGARLPESFSFLNEDEDEDNDVLGTGEKGEGRGKRGRWVPGEGER